MPLPKDQLRVILAKDSDYRMLYNKIIMADGEKL